VVASSTAIPRVYVSSAGQQGRFGALRRWCVINNPFLERECECECETFFKATKESKLNKLSKYPALIDVSQ
jgi:hypothetical protein